MSVQDQFQGAEADISRQRRSALEAVAQFGRRGLEEGVVSARDLQSRRNQNVQDTAGLAADFKVPAAMRAELAAGARGTLDPYAQDARVAQRQFREEVGAAAQANSTFFNQARQAVPALRSQASQVVEQYRQAYEERQAEIRAEQEQRAEAARQAAAQLALRQREMDLQSQLAAQQMANNRAIAEANRAAMVASRPVAPPVFRPPSPPPPAPFRPFAGFDVRTGKWNR